MPAIKRERPDREELALAAFNQPMETLPEYLVPLAAALPVVAPHPPPSYEHLFAAAAAAAHPAAHPHPQRAYLDFHAAAAAAAHSHPHPPPPLPEDLMLERFSSIPDFQPFFDNGEPCIEVECGENKALLYIHKLCQGSKGPSIRYRGEWLTPNEFQFVSGRETAKDWKRSIRHKGKSLKTLMSKGILQVHPPICDCPGCRISSPVNRGRLAEKRTVPLPPSRTPKKELPLIFSPGDGSEESEKLNGHHPDVKQEEDLHISIMKRSRDNDLTSFISNLHQSRHQFVMPETPSRCDFKRSSLDVGTADDVLGKRRVCSPNSSSECPLESKKPRSDSPKENSHTPLLEGAVTHMTPEEHYRRMMSALNEHSTFEEQQQQQQRLYQLANSMTVPSHSDLLRARQEVAAVAAARNPSTMEAHLPAASNSSSQRRKQGLPQHRDSHFTEREISHPPPLLSPQNAPHIALGPHLRPPFLGVPSTLCQTPGYGFLQPAQAEMFARQQEMLRKQNLARLEMSAELIRQKELENIHRQRLLAGDPMSLHPTLPPDHPALRNVHDIPEGHPLRDELSRRNAMLVLRHSNAPLLSLNHHGVPGASTTPPKEQAGRRAGRKSAPHRPEAAGQSESKELSESRPPDGNDEEMKDSESDAEAGEEKPDGAKAERSGSAGELKECKEAAKACDGTKELSELPTGPSAPCSSSSAESPSHLLGPIVNKNEAKYLPPASLPPPQALPFGFPYTVNPYFHSGTMGGLFLDGEESSALEDVSKWTVEDVCSFVGGLSGCAEYTQVFREQAIDGETLPLLTEEHLLNNMGLKLGPALKIRSQVAKRVGRVLYMASFPLAFPLQPPGLRPSDRELPAVDLRPSSTGSVASSPYTPSLLPANRISPKQENGNPLLTGLHDAAKPAS
uniref:Sterile alpha motif domain containing 11 n=1 Tax=Salvator merianae TaxID=96440 RepID=A0A8D0BR45_SALMN